MPVGDGRVGRGGGVVPVGLVLERLSGLLGRCGQPNILPHAIYEQPPQASLAVLQHRFFI